MTSSLVGSEMCIRDRFFLGTDDDVRAFQRIFPGTPHLGGVPLATNTEAVSYTHLTLPTICSV
eukprot:9066112-Prorocentrum_lima.AAC.1